MAPSRRGPSAVAAAVVGAVAFTCLAASNRLPSDEDGYAATVLREMDEGYYAVGEAWRAERERVLRVARSAGSLDEVHVALERAAGVAGGVHTSFWPPETRAVRVKGMTEEPQMPRVSSHAGVTTLRVPRFGSFDDDARQTYAATLSEGITDAVPQTCGWVVDIRANAGGNMNPMLGGLAPLLPDGPILSFESRDGVRTPVTLDGTSVLQLDDAQDFPPAPKVPARPVAVLHDDLTTSAGEVVVTAFRGLPNAKSFGRPTGGLSSSNTGIALDDGAWLVLTTAVYVDRDGEVIPEVPIRPDVETDDAEQAARAWLAERGCG